MIINTGNRTDIPAYYSEWFYNRIKEEYVLVRNPYFPEQVIKYKLTPDVVDVLCFCTKNLGPMLSRLNEISKFKQFWFVTITGYGKDVEPYVPYYMEVIDDFKQLSESVGSNSIGWRYDPVFINDKYTIEFHLECFESMAKELSGYTHQCVISFIDLYEKTKKNFRGVREVSRKDQVFLVKKFVEICKKYNIEIFSCFEDSSLSEYGVDVSGCMTKKVLEKSIDGILDVPSSLKRSREGCNCLLGNDIGAYNTCYHNCLYCYANYDCKTVIENMRLHDVNSPMIIGNLTDKDVIKEAKQVSYFNGQLSLF